jgi:hypothetical protein
LIIYNIAILILFTFNLLLINNKSR